MRRSAVPSSRFVCASLCCPSPYSPASWLPAARRAFARADGCARLSPRLGPALPAGCTPTSSTATGRFALSVDPPRRLLVRGLLGSRAPLRSRRRLGQPRLADAGADKLVRRGTGWERLTAGHTLLWHDHRLVAAGGSSPGRDHGWSLPLVSTAGGEARRDVHASRAAAGSGRGLRPASSPSSRWPRSPGRRPGGAPATASAFAAVGAMAPSRRPRPSPRGTRSRRRAVDRGRIGRLARRPRGGGAPLRQSLAADVDGDGRRSRGVGARPRLARRLQARRRRLVPSRAGRTAPHRRRAVRRRRGRRARRADADEQRSLPMRSSLALVTVLASARPVGEIRLVDAEGTDDRGRTHVPPRRLQAGRTRRRRQADAGLVRDPPAQR